MTVDRGECYSLRSLSAIRCAALLHGLLHAFWSSVSHDGLVAVGIED
jgi:hypothetical protein